MKPHVNTRSLMLGVAFLLFLSLFVTPRSASSQSSFSLALDLDTSEGDQAVTLLEVVPGKVVPIQIFGVDMQNANGISLHFGYDAAEVVYLGFEAAGIIPNALMFFERDSTSVRITVSSLSGAATANSGLVGTVRFGTTNAFSDTEIWLVRANLTRGGRSETVSPDLGVALQAPALPSPDFNGSGVVDFADFVLFAGVFGYREGDEAFDARYDLNIDNGIGFEDFVIFARSFGEAVNRAPVFAATAPVTRSVLENASGGQPVGDPISATDADGDALNYGLRGLHASSFAIDASTGQLRTRDGIAYDHEAKDTYTVTVRARDGQGGRASLRVTIAVTDVGEPPATAPFQFAVVYGDDGATVRWFAPADEAGKPPVSGYEVQRREADSDEWQEVQILESLSDTSLTLTDLTSDKTYQVRVRTLNEEGSSEWSAPVTVTLPTSVPPPSQPPPVVSNDVCNRTAQVRDAIVAAAGVSACGDVTAEHLAAVTSLSLGWKNITKLQAYDFSKLSSLKELNLRNNNISSLPANIFSDLSALEKLYLYDNDISSLDANLFRNLLTLKELALSFNAISSLDMNLFTYLAALKELYLNDNDIRTVPANLFRNLSTLEVLYLSDNDITSLDVNLFSNLSALTTLWLSENDISSLGVNLFSSLSALEKLSLSGNGIRSLDVSFLTNLSALKELNLYGNHIRNLDANLLTNLPALQELSLGGTGISTVPADLFSSLSALKELNLSDNHIKSLDANLFSNLSALEGLSLRANDISALPANLFSNLSALKWIDLTHNNIGGVNAAAFSGLTALEELWLGQNNLQSTSLPEGVFASLTALKTLSLASNQLYGLPMGIFSGLTSLMWVQVNGNPTDPLPINISLELVSAGQLRARAHTGAPFEMVLPLQVINGRINSRTGRFVIPRGRLESDVVTVTRTAGTTAAVTVEIASLPALPANYSGLTLARSTDLPLQVIAPSQ